MKEELLLLRNQLKMGHRISFAEAMLLQRAIDILVNNAGNSPAQSDCCPAQDGNSPVVPDGYVMVPKEPTEAMMLHNSGCQHHAWDDPDCAMRQTRRLIWSHMLAAAPQEVK